MTILKRIAIALILIGSFSAAIATPAAAAPKNDPLVAMFVWWNQAYKEKDGFTTEAFAKYFTPDAELWINGHESSKGLADMVAHFREIQKRTQSVVIVLPFIDEFADARGDKIFTHHFITEMKNGKKTKMRAMGYAVIKGGKISMVNLVRAPVDVDQPAK